MQITLVTTVHAPIHRVWEAYTTPADICQWNAASDEWHTSSATLELHAGGRFCFRMEPRDGGGGFDLDGTFDAVEPPHRLVSVLSDGRRVAVTFAPVAEGVCVTQHAEPDDEHPREAQRAGWQAILDRFAVHVETTEPEETLS